MNNEFGTKYDSNIISITDHAYERGKERLGFNRKTVKRMSEKAFSEGLNMVEMKGSLYNYFKNKKEYGKYEDSMFRVYGEMIFVYTIDEDKFFGDKHPVLITVLKVPNELKNSANTQYRKNKIS